MDLVAEDLLPSSPDTQSPALEVIRLPNVRLPSNQIASSREIAEVIAIFARLKELDLSATAITRQRLNTL
jgi:hypothetical protein